MSETCGYIWPVLIPLTPGWSNQPLSAHECGQPPHTTGPHVCVGCIHDVEEQATADKLLGLD